MQHSMNIYHVVLLSFCMKFPYAFVSPHEPATKLAGKSQAQSPREKHWWLSLLDGATGALLQASSRMTQLTQGPKPSQAAMIGFVSAASARLLKIICAPKPNETSGFG